MKRRKRTRKYEREKETEYGRKRGEKRKGIGNAVGGAEEGTGGTKEWGRRREKEDGVTDKTKGVASALCHFCRSYPIRPPPLSSLGSILRVRSVGES